MANTSIINPQSGKTQHIQAEAGVHYRIAATDGTIKSDFIAIREGSALILKYTDGTIVIFEGFYVACHEAQCEIVLPTEAADNDYIVTTKTPHYTTETGIHIIYTQGDYEALMVLANTPIVVPPPVDDNDNYDYDDIREYSVVLQEKLLLPSSDVLFRGLGLLAVGAAVAGSTGGSSSANTDNTPPIPTPFTIDGNVVLGPLVSGHGLAVEIYNAAGRELGRGEVDDDGSYSVSIRQRYSGLILVRITDDNADPDYQDEATGAPKDLGTDLRTITVAPAAGETKTVNVNPLTELATRKAGLASGRGADTETSISASSITPEQVTDAQAAVADAFGITGDDDTADADDLVSGAVKPTVDKDGDPTTGDDAPNAYGKALASLSGIEKIKDESTDAVLERLSESLSEQGLADDAKIDLVTGAQAAKVDGFADQIATDADEKAAFEAIASALDAIATAAATDDGTAITLAQLRALNLGTFADEDLGDIQAAIAAAEPEEVDTIPKLVSLIVKTIPPYVTNVYISSEPSLVDYYVVGDHIEITVTFSKTVVVTGTPFIEIQVGENVRNATYQADDEADGGSRVMVFSYEVQEGDADADGIHIDADAISLGDGTIKDGTIPDEDEADAADDADADADADDADADADDADASVDARLDHDEVDADPVHTVDTSGPAVTPTITHVEDDRGTIRDNLQDGDATDDDLPVIVGTLSRELQDNEALYIYDGSTFLGEAEVTGTDWEYVDERTLNDKQVLALIGVVVDTETDKQGAKSEQFTFNIDQTPPSVNAITISSDAGADAIYRTGDVIEFTVRFSEAVVVTGAPILQLIVGFRARDAVYDADQSEGDTVVFTYTVADNDTDANGLSVVENALSRQGGATITDSVGHDATLLSRALNNQAQHKINIPNTINDGRDDGLLIATSAPDQIDGGDGTDTVTYGASDAGVVVDLGKTTAQAGGHAAGDLLSNIENIIGSAYDDTLTGDTNNNKLSGREGNDTLNGGDGNDRLEGGVNDDTLNGGAGDDTLIGGTGVDTLDGGAGADMLTGGDDTDTASYANAAQVVEYVVAVDAVNGLAAEVMGVTGVYVNLNKADAQVGSEAEGDVLISIENLIGSGYNDVLIGDGNDNVLEGGAGDDILDGGAGMDMLTGGAGEDMLTGGAGEDRFVLDTDAEAADTDTILDFVQADGDRIQVDVDDGTEETLAGLGLAVLDNGEHANIVSADDNTLVYLILNDVDHQDIIDNFANYFAVI